MPRRVVYVIGQLGAGGTERQLLELVLRLDRSRWQPEVVTFTPRGALERDFSAACPIHVLNKTPLREAKVFIELTRLLRTLRPDVIHTSLYPANWRGALAASLAGRPVRIGSVRNMGDWMGQVRRRIERAALRGADAVVVNAGAVGGFLHDQVGVPREKIRMIPNGVDLDLFRPRREGEPDLRRELGGGSDAGMMLVGAVMSLTIKKNPLLLVEAAARLSREHPRARFVIAGEGPLRPALEAAAAASGLAGRFHFAGLRRDVPDVLRSIDLLVLTSDREGMPNVVLEAMATGVPTVATDVGGTGEIIQDRVTGRLVPPRDAEALALALGELLSEPKAVALMGTAARRRAEESFGLDGMVAATECLYSELIEARSAIPARHRAESPARGGRE